jgi:hypothetical protein
MSVERRACQMVDLSGNSLAAMSVEYLVAMKVAMSAARLVGTLAG